VNQRPEPAVSFFVLVPFVARDADHTIDSSPIGEATPGHQLDRSPTLSHAPLIATPQAYPLLCINELDMCFFVVGWTATGTPVGVPESELAAMGHTTTGAREIKGGGRLTYEMPRANVSIAEA
jgi:hypothetical protein